MIKVNESGIKQLSNLLKDIRFNADSNTAECVFKPLEFPAYKELILGRWRIIRKDALFLPGYFSKVASAVPNYVLLNRDTVWMSLTPMEKESLSPHAMNAKGHTVIMGLGMGMLLYNVCKNEAVERVTVIEKDLNIIKLFNCLFSADNFENFNKITIIHDSALTWKPTDKVDFLSVDIWSTLGLEESRIDTQKIQKNVNADSVAFWGQELDFITWMVAKNKKAGFRKYELNLESYHAYLNQIRLPLIEKDNKDYPKLCFNATINQMRNIYVKEK